MTISKFDLFLDLMTSSVTSSTPKSIGLFAVPSSICGPSLVMIWRFVREIWWDNVTNKQTNKHTDKRTDQHTCQNVILASKKPGHTILQIADNKDTSSFANHQIFPHGNEITASNSDGWQQNQCGNIRTFPMMRRWNVKQYFCRGYLIKVEQQLEFATEHTRCMSPLETKVIKLKNNINGCWGRIDECC